MFGEFFAIVFLDIGDVVQEAVSFFIMSGFGSSTVLILRNSFPGLFMFDEVVYQFTLPFD